MIKKALLVGFVASGFVMSAHAGTGIYGSLSAGIGGMDTKNYSSGNNPFASESLRSGVSYRGALGYLMASGKFNYGLELGYTGYPKNTYGLGGADIVYTGHTIDLLGVGKYNFSETDSGFFLVGKAGAAYVSQKTELTSSRTLYKKTVNGVKPELAVGGGYNVNKNVAIDLTLSHVFGKQTDPDAATASGATQIASVNTLLAGLTYSFS